MITSQALISIIMPVRSGLPFIQETIHSIQEQSWSNWELIIVDDHSTDSTYDCVFAIEDPRISIYRTIGTGIIDALKYGYSKSKGQYITRMDADDLMPKNKLQRLKESIADRDNCVSTGFVKYFSDNGVKDGYQIYEKWLNKLCIDESHYNEIYKECVIPSPCWMMKRSDFDRIGAFDSEQYPEDYDLVFRMYTFGVRVVPVLDIMHLWRDHGARASRNDPNYADNRFLELKLRYFKKVECVELKGRVKLIGAGKKGKAIAKSLLNYCQMDWYTNNSKKIGVNIYNIVLKDYHSFVATNLDVALVAIGNPEEQSEVARFLDQFNLKKVYFFS